MAVAPRVPCQSQARREQRPHRIVAGITRKSGVTGENQTCRRILVHRTLQTLLEAAVIEIISKVVSEMLRREWLPTQAIVHGQLRCRLPGVLRVEREIILPVEKEKWTGLSITTELAEKEVRHAE